MANVMEKKEFENKKSTVVTLRSRYKSAYDTFISSVISEHYSSDSDPKFIEEKNSLCDILKEIEDVTNELLSHLNLLDEMKKELIRCKNLKLPALTSSLQKAVESQFEAWSKESVSDAKKAKLTKAAGDEAEEYLLLVEKIKKLTNIVSFTEEEKEGLTPSELNELLEFVKNQRATLQIIHTASPAVESSEASEEESEPAADETAPETNTDSDTSADELEAVLDELLSTEETQSTLSKPKRKLFGFGR